MPPAPISAKIEPDNAPFLSGSMDVTIIDANGMLSNILDNSVANSLTVDWKITGNLVPWVPPLDKYTVKAYLDALESGGTDYAFDTNPAGPTLITTGVLAGNTRTFANLQIPFAPASVAEGLYGLTVVLTHQPNPAAPPQIVGFVDCGVVQFF